MFHVNVFGFSPVASSSATGLLWNLLFRETSNTSVITFENLKEPDDKKKDSLFVFIVDVSLDEVKV